MTMPVFRVDPGNVRAGQIRFTAEEAGHIRAMRRQRGDVIRVSDGEFTEYEVELTELTHRGAAGRIRGRKETPEDRVVIRLGQAVPKGEKLDGVVQKAVELGVHFIHPILAERSVPRLDERRAADRLKRWMRVAEAARKQCGRVRPMEVAAPGSLSSFLDESEDADLKVVLHERSTVGLRKILSDARDIRSVALLVGPEGGFSETEVQTARTEGFIPCGIGTRILRTETAPIAAIAILGYVLGDLGEPGIESAGGPGREGPAGL